jgi:acetolactate synthase-1/2/3 large subunit
VTAPYDGGELLVDAFNALGADFIFSSPGSEWAPVWEALARRAADGSGAPRYFDLTHETVAVAMATGYGLVTRRSQGVLLHAAPGLMQGANAIHGALLAGVGMVVASSESNTYGDGDGPDPGGQWYRNLSFVGGPHLLAQPFTKWSNQVGSVATLFTMVTRAGELSERAPVGPVYLNVPLEVLLAPAQPPVHDWHAPAVGRRVSAAEDVAVVAELLAAAKKPLVITETAGRDRGGFEALLRLCEALGVGVIEPSSAVCANFPKDNPLHLGSELDPLIDEADLILLVNCRAPFYPPSRRPSTAKIVVIDEIAQRPHIVYQVLHADHYLEGGVPETLDALRVATLAAANGKVDAAPRAWAEAAHETWTSKTTELEAAATQGERIDPVALAVALRDVALREDAIVVDETITHSRIVQRHVGWADPDRYFYVQGGLGQGMGVALGVKLASGDRLTILTIGDGAYLYNPIVQSLQAAKEFGLPLLIVIFNNKKYLSMKMNHLRFYPDGAAVTTDNFLGVDLRSQPELAAFGVPFEMFHEEVTDPALLSGVLERAVAAVKSGTTAIVNVQLSK